MKLALVRHFRCGEEVWNHHTLLWVPDDLSAEEFEAKVREAQSRYLQSLQTYKEWRDRAEAEGRLNNGSWFSLWGAHDYSKYPDKTKTIAEIEALAAERRREYEEQDRMEKAARRTFGEYLSEAGFLPFWKHKPDLTYEADWGHHHGLPINYESTGERDLPGALEYEEF